MSSDFGFFGPTLGIPRGLRELSRWSPAVPAASMTCDGASNRGITDPRRYERQAEINDTSAACT